MNRMRISSKDINAFQKCPWLVSRFNHAINSYSQTQQIQIEAATRLFEKELELGYKPSFNPALKILNKRIKEDPDEFVVKTGDILYLKTIYDFYIEEIYDQGYRTIGANIELVYSRKHASYVTQVPAILANQVGKIIPVLYGNGIHDTSKNIEILYPLVIMKETYQVMIAEFLYIDLERISPKMQFKIITKNKLKESKECLDNQLDIIGENAFYPNYSHCFDCLYSKVCK